MKVKHTPGPWTVFHNEIRNNRELEIAKVPHWTGAATEESAANAKLIAAAPAMAKDLEDALKLLLELRNNGDPVDDDMWDRLDAFAVRAHTTLSAAGRLP